MNFKIIILGKRSDLVYGRIIENESFNNYLILFRHKHLISSKEGVFVNPLNACSIEKPYDK